MEKTGNEILEELKIKVADLQSQLDELKSRLSELEVTDTEFTSPVDISFDDENPEEAAAEPKVAAESRIPIEVLEDIPADIIDNVPQEIADEFLNDLPDAKEEPVTTAVSAPVAEAAPAPSAISGTYAWQIDIPGAQINNIISGISLNDRVLFINTLFKEDPMLFQATVNDLNGLTSFSEAENYIVGHFPDWNLKSDVVYRLMMAVRRKLK